MVGLLYLQLALLMLTLLVWAAQLRHAVPTVAATLAVPVAAGLLYDNVVLALGAALSAGPLLLSLNWPRYLLEALVAPLFLPLYADLARRAGASRLAARPARLLVTAATLGLAVYGLAGLIGLDLVATVGGGVVRYVEPTPGVPVIGVAITLAAIAAGAAIWRARGWPWLLWVAIAIFVASGASAAFGRDMICAVTNAGELALLSATLACERHLRGRQTRMVPV